MKKVLIVSILFIAMISLYGCSNAYESDGTVTVKKRIMAKLFLRTTRKSGIAKLYTRVQRNGMNMIVCTGVSVSIKE